MEYLLILLLTLGNGWQFYENGKLTQENVQLKLGLEEQSAIVKECYAETRSLEDILIKTQGSLRELAEENTKRSVELEKLRYTDPESSSYLSLEIPSELVQHLSTYTSDKD